MSASSPRIPQKSPSAAWQRVDGEVVLLNVDGHELLGLNGLGGRVWNLIDGARTIDELIATVAAEFADVPRAQIAIDVEQFIEELAREKMIVVTVASAAK